jgi:hypothetical protein
MRNIQVEGERWSLRYSVKWGLNLRSVGSQMFEANSLDELFPVTLEFSYAPRTEPHGVPTCD